jgi:hypothetical protein
MKKVIFICWLACVVFYFSCTPKTPSAENPAETSPAGKIDIPVIHTESDFYGEWYCEIPPQKITETFEMAGSKNTYIFYANNMYEINFSIIGQEDDPIKSRGRFSVVDSDIIIAPEYNGIADGRWLETKGLEAGPFAYPYKFIDEKLQINDEVYVKIK